MFQYRFLITCLNSLLVNLLETFVDIVLFLLRVTENALTINHILFWVLREIFAKSFLGSQLAHLYISF